MDKKNYAVCLYLDPDAPQSRSPDTPGAEEGRVYQLANYQWFSTPDEPPEATSHWDGARDNPTLTSDCAERLCFWAVGNYSMNTNFIIRWRDGDGSPIGDGTGKPITLEGTDKTFFENVPPPGYDEPRSAWFFGSTPINFKDGASYTYSFTVEVQPGPGSKGPQALFFVDPEMETEGGG